MVRRDNLVGWFVKNEYNLHQSMVNSNHSVGENINIYHAEGSVWTHTMMVATWIEAKRNVLKERDYLVLITSALLHDIGKPTCEELKEATEDKPLRNAYHGHEGVSTMLAVGILKKLQKEFDEYTDDVVKDILKVISLHGCAIETKDEYLHYLLTEFNQADKNGACRQVDESTQGQYSNRKFLKQNRTQDKELILMVGLPCSGKSTYIKENLSDYCVVSRDEEIMNYIRGDLTYNEKYNAISGSNDFDKHFDEVIKQKSKSCDKIVVDMTMMSLKSRRSMMSNFNGFKRKAIVMMCDSNTLAERNRNRVGKTIPESVFENMSKQFTMPVDNEGFEDILIVL